jgi:hypothetical protein
MIALQIEQLRQLLITAANLGASSALRSAGLDKPQISKADACRRYGRRNVDKWIKEKQVIPIPKGKTSIVLNVNELEAISQSHIVFYKHLRA